MTAIPNTACKIKKKINKSKHVGAGFGKVPKEQRAVVSTAVACVSSSLVSLLDPQTLKWVKDV